MLLVGVGEPCLLKQRGCVCREDGGARGRQLTVQIRAPHRPATFQDLQQFSVKYRLLNDTASYRDSTLSCC